MMVYLGQDETVSLLLKWSCQSAHVPELVSTFPEVSKVTWASDKPWNHRECHQHTLFEVGHSHIWKTLPRLLLPCCSSLIVISFPVRRICHRIVLLSWWGNEGEPLSGEAESSQLQTEERGEVYKSAGPLEHCLRRYHELITLTWDVKFLLPHK